MRVGVQGRVIAGPAGAPSQVEVPLRYAVVKEGVDPKTITTKFRRFPVAVAPGTANVVFTDIEEDLCIIHGLALLPVDGGTPCGARRSSTVGISAAGNHHDAGNWPVCTASA